MGYLNIVNLNISLTRRSGELKMESVLSGINGFLEINRVGDWVGIVSLFISLLGFGATLISVRKSRDAAERAAEAANEVRKKIGLFDITTDISEAITILEEIKRIQRSKNWISLPDRYAYIRKIVIRIRNSSDNFTDKQNLIFQEAVSTLTTLEKGIERHVFGGAEPNSAVLNEQISKHIDGLSAVLVQLKYENASIQR